jgi:hypothetical protein
MDPVKNSCFYSWPKNKYANSPLKVRDFGLPRKKNFFFFLFVKKKTKKEARAQKSCKKIFFIISFSSLHF